MVKAVQAEDSVEQHFDGLLKERVPAQVGLLIGKPSVGSRDLVLVAVPTPSVDGKQPLSVSATAAAGGSSSSSSSKPGKKSGAAGASKSKAGEPGMSIQVDTEGVAVHAEKVTFLLPGGLAVLGLYLFAPEAGYSSCSRQLAEAVANIASDAATTASPKRNGSTAAATMAGTAAATTAEKQQELLLLHVDSTNRKFTMRSCLASNGAATAAASLKPIELKFGPSLASLVALRSSHSFDITLPAIRGSAQLQQLLEDAAAAEAVRVASSLALLQPSRGSSGSNGSSSAAIIAGSSSQPLADLLPPSGSGVSGGGNRTTNTVWVDLYCSPSGSGSPPAAAVTAASTVSSSSSVCAGSCRLQGCVEAVAFVHRRDPAAKALADLKQDIAHSLRARLAMLEEDILDASEAAKEDAAAAAAGGAGGKAAAAAAAQQQQPAHPLLADAGGAKKTLCGLPRRVLLPWSDLGLQVCAYLADGEGPKTAVQHVQEWLPLPDLQPEQVQEVERTAVQQSAVKGAAVTTAAGGGSGAAAGACGSTVMAAAAAGAVAALSVVLAYVSIGQQ